MFRKRRSETRITLAGSPKIDFIKKFQFIIISYHKNQIKCEKKKTETRKKKAVNSSKTLIGLADQSN